LKRPEEAIEALRRAVALRTGFVVAINDLGIALREARSAEEALELPEPVAAP
jgi:hypothetical protein